MAMNPNSIMADLRMKSDKELQAFAAMHKNDPFIFPLAFQESQTRQRMRMAQDAQMAGQEQPKVVDQDLAQMMPQAAPQQAPQQDAQLPEDSGIAQLPAQNMQGMAVGGIVAFDEGGEVPRYYDGDLIKRKEIPTSTFQKFKGMLSPWSDEDIRSMEAQDFANKNDPGFFEKLTPSQRAVREQESADARAGKGSTYTLRNGWRSPAEQAKVMADAQAPDTSTKVEKTDSKAGSRKEGAGSGSTTSAPTGGIDALTSAYKPSTAQELMKSAREMAGDANKESEAAYKPYAEMLQKERADLDTRKGESKNMALIQAGLAMMSGTSRNAFENIGKGGMQGLAAFQEAKRLDDASKKALMASEIAMMQAQRAERSGNHKDAVAILGQAEHSKEFGVTAAMKAQELRQTGAYQQGMLGVYQERNKALGAGAKHEEKKMAEFGKIQTKVMGMLKDDMNYLGLKTDAEREAYKTKLLRNEMMNNPFLSASAANIGFVPAPTGGKQRGDYTDMEQ